MEMKGDGKKSGEFSLHGKKELLKSNIEYDVILVDASEGSGVTDSGYTGIKKLQKKFQIAKKVQQKETFD